MLISRNWTQRWDTPACPLSLTCQLPPIPAALTFSLFHDFTALCICMCSSHCPECFSPLFSLNQTHLLQSCSHVIFAGKNSAFSPGVIGDPIFCVLTPLLNYNKIGTCKCPCAFLDHELLRIFRSLLSPLCPQRLIQSRHSIHTCFITKWKYGWSGGECPLEYSGNFSFLQGDTWTGFLFCFGFFCNVFDSLSLLDQHWAESSSGPRPF